MHRVVIVAYAGVQSLDVVGPAEVFGGATRLLSSSDGRDGYDVTIASFEGGVVETESAVRLDTIAIDALGRRRIDTLVVPGGHGARERAADPRSVEVLTTLIGRSRRLVTVCSGALFAAATGALDGHRVTTHWARADRLAEQHPDVTVDADPIFVHSRIGDDDVWSSAGVTAGIDLALGIVEHDHSTEVAQTAARWLVMFLRRPGGQSQFATATWIRQAPAGPIRRAQDIVLDDPGGDHRVGELARRVAMSERHFIRRFTGEVGVSPAKFVAGVRIDAARHELERSDDTIAAIAGRCGFGSAETLRRSLHRHLGVSPEAYRQRFAHHRSDDERTPA